MTVYYRPRFLRVFCRFDPQIQKRIKQHIALFEQDPFDPKLNTHSLHGKLKGFWSFSVGGGNRVLFQFLDKRKDKSVFLDVGDHSIYR